MLNTSSGSFNYACFGGGVGFDPKAAAKPADDNLAVASAYIDGGPILVFAAGSDGDTSPIAAIGGPFTGLYGPSAIAVSPGNP